jgi:hypothetical protein
MDDLLKKFKGEAPNNKPGSCPNIHSLNIKRNSYLVTRSMVDSDEDTIRAISYVTGRAMRFLVDGVVQVDIIDTSMVEKPIDIHRSSVTGLYYSTDNPTDSFPGEHSIAELVIRDRLVENQFYSVANLNNVISNFQKANFWTLLGPPNIRETSSFPRRLNIYFDNHKSPTGHFYVELLAPNEERGKFFGQNPEHDGMPKDKGYVKNELKRFEEAIESAKATVIKKTIMLSKEDFRNAFRLAEIMRVNPKNYCGHVGYDCLSFAQEIYVAAGQEGDFIDLFTTSELNKMGLAGVSAKIRFGAGDKEFTVYGTSREEVAKEHGVHIDRVVDGEPAYSQSEWSIRFMSGKSQFIILPKITDNSEVTNNDNK